MGIQKFKRSKSGKLAKNKELRSSSVYREGLVKLYTALARKTGSTFYEKVLKQLRYPKRMRVPLSIKKIVSIIAENPEKNSKLIFCSTSTITNDTREMFGKDHYLKGIRVCAYKMSNSIREIIKQNGGEIIEWADLPKTTMNGKGCRLLLGKTGALRRYKYMGPACGLKGSKTWERGPKKRVKNYTR
eukprot:GAHX01000202.1.p1 GENE.GAHX01000202.1~~GAHX01000202.1.p1  ORF type:complete len:187 (-),score=28.29 GAHX01000202.1:41-601(-)